MSNIKIGHKEVGQSQYPFIIAEMSGNHNQSLDRALKIVEAAADAGVDAIKIQTFTADSMTLNIGTGDFLIDDPNNPWNGQSLYELYGKAATPFEWHEKIFKRSKELGLVAFSSPFDATAVDFLEELGAPCYKIASSENVDIPLIKKVSSTGKPVIISTGMATLEEVSDAVETAKSAGCNDLILLKCTCSYPSSPSESNILTIPDLKNRFGVQVGLSDHTLGIGVAVASVSLGAVCIEKHLTLSKADGGVDADFSLEPAEFKHLVTETRRAWESLGNVSYGPSESEKQYKKYRRSIYVAEDLKQGDKFSSDNLRCIRPGLGLPPKHFEQLLGRTAACDISKGTALSWELVEEVEK